MATWQRGALIFAGLLLLFLGLGKAVWAFHAWDVLSREKERPTLYPDGPRVFFRLEIAVAAVGGTVLLLAVLAK
jgi:hypothetical protein